MRAWMHWRHCLRDCAISDRVSNHLWAGSCLPQPMRRHLPAQLKSRVMVFIYRDHVSVCPPIRFLQLYGYSENNTRRGKRSADIRNTWPNHLKPTSFTCCSNEREVLLFMKTISRTLALLIRWSQETCAILRRHLWSNTDNRRMSSARRVHVSLL